MSFGESIIERYHSLKCRLWEAVDAYLLGGYYRLCGQLECYKNQLEILDNYLKHDERMLKESRLKNRNLTKNYCDLNDYCTELVEENQKLKNEYDDLIDENNELDVEVEKLRSKILDLEKVSDVDLEKHYENDIEDHVGEIRRLEEVNQKLQKQIDQYYTNHKDLQDRYDLLLDDFHNVSDENTKLFLNEEEMCKEIEELEEEIHRLGGVINDLNNKINEVEREKDTMRKDYGGDDV